MRLPSHLRFHHQRSDQGYLIPSQVPVNTEVAGKRCYRCRHFANVFEPRCDHGDFPVKSNATCRLWVPVR